jgi:acyl carrier protein
MIKIKDIEKVLSNTFPNTKIDKPTIDLQLGDFDEWDSLGNFNLLLAIEKFYNIRFSVEQMSEIKSIKTLIKNLESINS